MIFQWSMKQFSTASTLRHTQLMLHNAFCQLLFYLSSMFHVLLISCRVVCIHVTSMAFLTGFSRFIFIISLHYMNLLILFCLLHDFHFFWCIVHCWLYYFYHLIPMYPFPCLHRKVSVMFSDMLVQVHNSLLY